VELKEKVTKYYEVDTQVKSLTSEKSKLNASIKADMKAGNLKDFEVDGIKAVYNSYDKSSMNQDKLLQRLKDLGLTQCIKTVEVVDEKVLEDMIYKDEVKAVKFEDCAVVTPVETLTVKKVKKSKKGDK
jgi:hypothetical protein